MRPAKPYALVAVAVLLAAAAVAVPRYLGGRRDGPPVEGGGAQVRQDRGEPQARVAPTLVVQTGHTMTVAGLTFSKDGRLLASVSDDGTVKIWDVERGWEVRSIFTGVGGWVSNRDVMFTTDGRWLVMSFTFRRTEERFKAWDAETGEEFNAGPDYRRGTSDSHIIRESDKIVLWDSVTLDAIEGDEGAFSPDGRLVAVSAKDTGTIALWDVAGRRVARRILFAAQMLSFSPDGRWFSAMSADAKTTRTWDARSFQELPRRLVEPASVSRFSPDGRWLATPTGSLDLQELPDGKRVRCGSAAGSIQLPAWFSPDSQLAASVIPRGLAEAELVSVCQIESGTELAWFPAISEIKRVAFSPDGRSLAIAGADGVLLAGASGGWKNPVSLETKPAEGLAFSPNGELLAWGDDDGAINVRTLAREGAPRVFAPRTRSVDAVALSADGRRLAAVAGGAAPTFFRLQAADLVEEPRADTTATVKVWEASGAVHSWTAPAGADLGGFTANGESVVLSSARALTTYAAVTGAMERSVKYDRPSLSRFSAARERLSLAPLPGNRKGGGSRDAVLTVLSGETGERSAALRYPDDQGIPLTAVSDDGRRMAMAIGTTAVSVFDTATWTEVAQVPSDGVSELALSADGRFLGVLTFADAFLYDTGSQQTSRGLLPNGDASVLTFSHDGRWLALGGDTITLFDTATGRRAHTLAGHSQPITSLVFSADGRWLVSASGDGTVRVWDPRAGTPRATLVFLDRQDEWLVVTPEGFFDGSPGSWRDILWRFGRTRDVAPVEIFFNEFYYPGLLQELLGGAELRAPRAIADVDRRQPAVRLVEHVPHMPDSRRVSLRIEVDEAPGGGARDLRLFRNGTLVKAWHGDAMAGPAPAPFTVEVPVVAGANRFTAYAFNRDNVKSDDATLLITGSQSLARPGIVYVVAIGVDRYANPSFNLRYAAADARRFAAEIETQRRRLDPAAQVKIAVLLDEDATRLNIRRALLRLSDEDDRDLPGPPAPLALETLRTVEPEDTVIVFFSGHGLTDGERFYLVPHDLGSDGQPGAVDTAVAATIASRSVSNDDLERALERIPSAATILVIDACYSGQALESRERRVGPMNTKGLAQLAYEKGMYVLTAAQGYQVALETGRLGHGLLTYALVVDGLVAGAADQAPRDRRILAREWLDFAAERVPVLHRETVGGARDLQPADTPRPNPGPAQQPRVFYRRESDARPFVVAIPRPPTPGNP